MDGGVWLKPGAAVAYRGDLTFERLPTLGAGSVQDAVLREAAPLVRASRPRAALLRRPRRARAHRPTVRRLDRRGVARPAGVRGVARRSSRRSSATASASPPAAWSS